MRRERWDQCMVINGVSSTSLIGQTEAESGRREPWKVENAVSLIGDAVRDAVADASQSPSVSVVSTQRVGAVK